MYAYLCDILTSASTIRPIYGPQTVLVLDQIAGRLESLQRASLDVSGGYSSPPDVHPSQLDTLDGDTLEHGSDAVDSRLNRSGGDTKALLAAAREFLSRRCAASLASADCGTRHEEKLAEALVGGTGRPLKVSASRVALSNRR